MPANQEDPNAIWIFSGTTRLYGRREQAGRQPHISWSNDLSPQLSADRDAASQATPTFTSLILGLALFDGSDSVSG